MLLRSNTDIDREMVRLDRISTKTEIYGISVDLRDLLNKQIVGKEFLEKYSDRLFDSAIRFYRSVLRSDNLGFYDLESNDLYDGFRYRILSSSVWEEENHLPSISAMVRKLPNDELIILLNKDKILEEIEEKSSRFGLGEELRSELFKSTFYGIFLHEIFHCIQHKNKLKIGLLSQNLLPELIEGGPIFIEDLSALVIMNKLVRGWTPKGRLDLSGLELGYGFGGLKNISFLIDLYEKGDKQILNKEFEYTLGAYLHNLRRPTDNKRVLDETREYKDAAIKKVDVGDEMDWDHFRYFDNFAIGEVFCAKIYLSFEGDLKKSINKILSLSGSNFSNDLINAIKEISFT